MHCFQRILLFLCFFFTFSFPAYSESSDEGILSLSKEAEAITESEEENELIEVDDSTEEIVDTAISYAKSKIGYPYSNSRRLSGSAYDCSSLVYLSYLDAGIDLSYGNTNTAAAIANGLVAKGQSVSGNDLQEGDLLFYSSGNNGRYHGINHVAMYIGDGLQIEASASRQMVKISYYRTDGLVDICRPVTG